MFFVAVSKKGGQRVCVRIFAVLLRFIVRIPLNTNNIYIYIYIIIHNRPLH